MRLLSGAVAKGDPADSGAGGELGATVGGNDLAVDGGALAVDGGDLAVGAGDFGGADLGGLDLRARDLLPPGGGSCVRQSDCPGSGSAGCCATIDVGSSTTSGQMCGDPCPAAITSGGGSISLTIQTKLCADSGDCINYMGTVTVGGVPLNVAFDACCSSAGMAQKFCANTVGAPTFYTCN